MKHVLVSIKMLLLLSVVLGLGYPALVTLIAQVGFPKQANGSLVFEGDRLIGSALIGQNFEKPGYFWSRPSAAFGLPSGGSNAGPTAKALAEQIAQRATALRAAHPGAGEPPAHLLYASGSGLDPHQSPDAIRYQIGRVAAARGLSATELNALVDAHVEKRQLGLLGEPVVNVLALNRALDKLTLAKSNSR